MRPSTKKMPPSDGQAKCRGHFLDRWLRKEGPAHGGQWHHLAGVPGLYKKPGEKAMEKQQCSVVSASWLPPWRPSAAFPLWWLRAESAANTLLEKLLLALEFITAIPGTMQDRNCSGLNVQRPHACVFSVWLEPAGLFGRLEAHVEEDGQNLWRVYLPLVPLCFLSAPGKQWPRVPV